MFVPIAMKRTVSVTQKPLDVDRLRKIVKVLPKGPLVQRPARCPLASNPTYQAYHKPLREAAYDRFCEGFEGEKERPTLSG